MKNVTLLNLLHSFVQHQIFQDSSKYSIFSQIHKIGDHVLFFAINNKCSPVNLEPPQHYIWTNDRPSKRFCIVSNSLQNAMLGCCEGDNTVIALHRKHHIARRPSISSSVKFPLVGDKCDAIHDSHRLANTIDQSDVSTERIDFASIDDDPVDESSPTLEQQPPPLFVPPIQAPNQTSYIPAISLGNRCKAWPYCKDMSCRNNNMKLCKKLGGRLKVDEAFVKEVTTARKVALRREKKKQRSSTSVGT